MNTDDLSLCIFCAIIILSPLLFVIQYHNFATTKIVIATHRSSLGMGAMKSISNLRLPVVLQPNILQ